MFGRPLGFKSKSPSDSEADESMTIVKRPKLADVPVVTMMEIQEPRLISPSKSLRRRNEEKKQAMMQRLQDEMARYREDYTRRSSDPNFEPCNGSFT